MSVKAPGKTKSDSAPLRAIAAVAATLLVASPIAVSQTEARSLFVDTSAESLEDAMASVVVILPEWPKDAKRTEEPEASGVVWTTGRHIVTAHHVIAKARTIQIKTRDGRILPAQLAGHDAATDLALLRINDDLPPATFATGDPAPGEQTCAIGNAFGLGLSLTCGVVSAINKAGVGFNPIEDFVQTDAAVNPGASGGALVNRDGQIIGILSAIFTKTSDANIGVNFAVSTALTQRIVNDLLDDGRVVRRNPGVRLAGRSGRFRGAPGRLMAPRVVGVATGSPAEAAGLAIGDEIIEAAGRRTQTPAEFNAALDLARVSGSLKLRVARGTTEIETTLELGKVVPRGQ
ncbi:MAG: trypsin-like peptidase domain-containing protein [Pseudomonadota bacterium]